MLQIRFGAWACHAKRGVVLGDVAAWVENVAQIYFGHAQLIADLHHASERVGESCRAVLVAPRRPRRAAWLCM
jgi:hypothetical protein